MKLIGLLGGMSWESTVTYYQLINTYTKEKLGGLHSAKCLLYSVDFQEIENCQKNNDWTKAAEILGEAAQKLEQAGAEFLLICTNTMHKVYPQIQAKVKIPVLHIAQATLEVLQNQQIKKIALLGTKYTMQQDFYKKILITNGIEVIVPSLAEQETVNQIIFTELCQGIIEPASKAKYLEIISSLARQGSQGVILGCTEIGLLIKQADTEVPLFDTTIIHARQAAELAWQK